MPALRGLPLIEVDAAPGDAFLNARLFISITLKGEVELLIKS